MVRVHQNYESCPLDAVLKVMAVHKTTQFPRKRRLRELEELGLWRRRLCGGAFAITLVSYMPQGTHLILAVVRGAF